MKTNTFRLSAYYAAVTLLISISYAACSQDTPPTTQAQYHLQKLINDTSEGRIRLDDFERLDGRTVTYGGSEGYLLSWEAQIEFLEDCYWPVGLDPLKSEPLSGELALSSKQGQVRRKGERTAIKGTFHFEKTEKGWNVTGIEYP